MVEGVIREVFRMKNQMVTMKGEVGSWSHVVKNVGSRGIIGEVIKETEVKNDVFDLTQLLRESLQKCR